jgi:predicted transcriptional regulator
MSPEDKKLLYYFNMATDAEGEYRVGRANVAALLNCSVVTAVKRVANLVALGYVKVVKFPFALGRGHGYKYQYSITERGVQALSIHYDDAKELFDLHKSQRLSDAIAEARRISKKSGKKRKVHEKQLSLFGDES